jgi:hypothetical protein
MVIMFQPWAAKLVREHKKFQTVRPLGKRAVKSGDRVSLREWAGLPYRSPQVRIYDSVIKVVIPIKLSPGLIECDGKALLDLFDDIYDGYNDFAQRDGFGDFNEMTCWFAQNYGIPFIGRLITWEMPV